MKYSATWRPLEVFAPFLQSPLAAQLAVLRWNVHDSFVADVVIALAAHAPPTSTARVDLYFLSLRRGSDGRWSEVEVDLYDPDDEIAYSNSKLRTLRRLDASGVSRVTIRARPGDDVTKPAGEFDAVRAHFPHAALTFPTR